MTQTGPSVARALKVFRRRITDLWDESALGKVWYPEDGDFTAPPQTVDPIAPASLLRLQPNRTFESPFGWGAETSMGQGSMSLFFGVQARDGMIEQQEAAETAIRLIASAAENDQAEDVHTRAGGGLEMNPGSSPPGILASIRDAFSWQQFVIPYKFAEGF